MELQNAIIFTCLGIWILFGFYLVLNSLFLTPFYPSNFKKLNQVFDKFKIKSKGKKFIDLGSGDGRIVRWAAKKGFYATGIEINPFLTLWSRFLNFILRLGRKTKILNQSYYNIDFSNYDVVYCYIFSEDMHKLEDKIFKSMKSGSFVISNTFSFKNHKPDLVEGRFKVYKL